MSSSDGGHTEVNENYPDFDYNRLQAPPEEWELYDIPDKTHLRNRALDLRTFKILVKHHTWGIHVVVGERRTKERLLQVLKRVIFNQAPNLRPTWHEFISRNCDAGPRLLRRSYNALQISRNYPHGMPGESIYLQPPGTHNPQLGVPPGLQAAPFTHISNQLGPLGATNFSAVPHAGQNTLPPMQAGLLSAPVHEQTQVSEPAKTSSFLPANYDTQLPSTNNVILPTQDISRYSGQAAPELEWSIPSRAQTVSPASIRSSMEQTSALSASNTCEVIEAVERAVMSFPYKALQRHPDAEQTTCQAPNVIASPNLCLTSSTPRLNSTFSHIRAVIVGEIPALAFDPTGIPYPYRGRGPVSRPDTTAVDCAIVSGALLDAGSTIADRGDDTNWTYRLSRLEKAFLDTLRINWNILSDADSANRRDELRDILVDWFSNRGISMVPANVWSVCTESFKQFHIRYTEQLHPCACQRAAPTSAPHTVSFVSPEFYEEDAEGIDLADLLARFFQPSHWYNCPQCGSPDSNRIDRVFGELPWRLVIRLDQRTMLQSHALRYITFEYTDSNRLPQQATYRWLGGIYCVLIGQEYHFRVYWNDNERGEADNGAIRVYDGTQLAGAIVGGLRAARSSQWIPNTWWVGDAPPLLFYEKVVNPDSETLRAARVAMQNILNAAANGQLILQHHRGWTPQNYMPRRRTQTRRMQEIPDERGTSGQLVLNQELHTRTSFSGLYPYARQSPRPTRTSGSKFQSQFNAAVQRQQHVQRTRHGILPQSQNSSDNQQMATGVNQRAQQSENTGQLRRAAKSPCLVPTFNPEDKTPNTRLAPNSRQANIASENNRGVQSPTAQGSSSANVDLGAEFRPEFDLPDLDTVAGLPYTPATGSGTFSDVILRNFANFDPSTTTTTTNATPGGAVKTLAAENTGSAEYRPSNESWATRLEALLEDNGSSGNGLSTSSTIFGAPTTQNRQTTAQRQPSADTNALLPPRQNQIQSKPQEDIVDLSTASITDEAGIWAFDFDAASTELPNPTHPAPAVDTIPTTEPAASAVATTVITGSNVVGDVLQGYIEGSEPFSKSGTGHTQNQPGMLAGYFGELTEAATATDARVRGDCEKRKREHPEDVRRSSKRAKQ
ncbi:hypothetical protein PRK78_007501 [Emydomyces testavorans]|uniref:Uncharacterized protein n=1 Tax=Emydomyces testavorans TaxID=2070801 RepID=A0AAF0DRI7_9EURO|nr:hypothetical protein PRK78_007501 [Emydomyces testavorans]